MINGVALFPRLARKNPIWVHGHRGSASTHPEHTLSGIQEARAAGADFFEVDLHLTEDDVAVVFHDTWVTGRVCHDKTGKRVRGKIPLSRLKAAQLRDYECGRVPNRLFPERLLSADVRILTLEEVLRWVRDEAPEMGINIEIKMLRNPVREDHCRHFVNLVVDRVFFHGLQKQVQIQSFHGGVLRETHALAPEIPLSRLFYKTRDIVTRAKAVGATMVGPHFRTLTPAIVRQCHHQGLLVVPYTVNDPADWGRLLAMGVDGIITDRPRKLVEFLAHHAPTARSG